MLKLSRKNDKNCVRDIIIRDVDEFKWKRLKNLSNSDKRYQFHIKFDVITVEAFHLVGQIIKFVFQGGKVQIGNHFFNFGDPSYQSCNFLANKSEHEKNYLNFSECK